MSDYYYYYYHHHHHHQQHLNQLHGAGPFLRSQQVLRYSRNTPHFTERGSSFPHSHVPATCPCPDPHQSRPCPPSHFLKMNFNIIPTSMLRSSKWSLDFRSLHQNPVRTSLVIHTCYIHSQSHYSWFDHPNDILWGVKIRKFLVM